MTPVLNEDGQVRIILCLSRNVTRQRQAELKLKVTAEQDQLTGIANRRLFNATLRKSLQVATKKGANVGLLIVDLDNFKQINDSYGHDAGDLVLKKAAKKLALLASPQNLVARLGGDEFAILMKDLSSSKPLFDLAEAIVNAFDEPVVYQRKEIQLYATVGGAITSVFTQDASTLLKESDTALYIAKAAGRNTYRIIDYELPESRLIRNQMDTIHKW